MLLTDYPWYFGLLCVLIAAIYTSVMYFAGRVPYKGTIRWVLAAIRFVAVFSLAFLLLGPMVKNTVTEKQNPHVVLAQDISASVRNSADSSFVLEQLVPTLEGRCRVSYVTFGNEATTDIGSVLEQFRTDDVEAMILASDGLHNRDPIPPR